MCVAISDGKSARRCRATAMIVSGDPFVGCHAIAERPDAEEAEATRKNRCDVLATRAGATRTTLT
jgi:hypothetical protein